MLVPTVQYETYIYCVVPHCFCTVLYFIVSILYCTSLYLYWGSISCRCTSIVHWTVPCTLYTLPQSICTLEPGGAMSCPLFLYFTRIWTLYLNSTLPHYIPAMQYTVLSVLCLTLSVLYMYVHVLYCTICTLVLYRRGEFSIDENEEPKEDAGVDPAGK